MVQTNHLVVLSLCSGHTSALRTVELNKPQDVQDKQFIMLHVQSPSSLKEVLLIFILLC